MAPHSTSDSQTTVSSSSQSVPSSPPYPFTWTPLSAEERLERRKVYFSHGPWCVSPRAPMLDLVRSQPGRVLMPTRFASSGLAEKIFSELKLRPDDVIVTTYPKCGTTFMQELVWQILHGLDSSGRESLLSRSPFLEMAALTDDAKSNEFLEKWTAALEAVPSPRIIKTHLPLTMLPAWTLATCKVVLVARNPFDCCVSFFHHERLVPKQGFAGTFNEYAQLFRRGDNPMGDYFYHLKSGWSARHHHNAHFVWYEDMRADLGATIDGLCSFLGRELTLKQKAQLEAHLQIDNFRSNSAVNMSSAFCDDGSGCGSFIREGSVGGWSQYFTPEMMADWGQWIEAETQDTDIVFKLGTQTKTIIS